MGDGESERFVGAEGGGRGEGFKGNGWVRERASLRPPTAVMMRGIKKGKKERRKKKQVGELRRGRGGEDGKRGEWGKVLEDVG